MSTEQANKSVSPGQFDAIMQRIDELESTVEEQAEIIETQQDEIETLQNIIEVRSDSDSGRIDFEDVWIANTPIGRLVERNNTRSRSNESSIEEIEEHGVKASTDGGQTMPAEVRDRMLPIHKMWVDVREDQADQLGASDTRAARLFGRFIKRAAGEPEPTVDASGKNYTMDSGDARDVLEQAADITKTGKSMVVKRAMKQVESYTVVADGEEPLITFDKNRGKNTLSVSKTRFNAVMKNVEAAIKGSVEIGTEDDRTDDTNDAESIKAERRMNSLEQGTR